uniref:SF3 helicase domain-containing protein n=1 Tax=viral metagenome TaxID=1070528 RepID=A0A6C0LZW2_9ZZZZ
MTDMHRQNKVATDFKAFMEGFRVRKENGNGVPISHTSFCKNVECELLGSFYFPQEKILEFWKWYKKALKFRLPVCITERHIDVSPFLVDIDFKQNCQNRIYDDSIIKLVISKYYHYASQFLDMDIPDNVCYVFEKKKPSIVGDINDGTQTYKDGFHLMFPNLISRPTVQFVVRLMVINDIGSTGAFSHLPIENDLKDIFDEAVIYRNGWMLYGSNKPSGQKYELTKIYDMNCVEINVDDMIMDMDDLSEELSIRKPLQPTIYVNNMSEEKVEMIYEKLSPRAQRKAQTGKPDEVRMAQILVGLLSPKRNNTYKEWIELGFCLHNIDDSLLDTWIDFSKLSSKFKGGECEKAWKGFRDTGITIKSLHYWARKDNPGGYGDMLLNELSEVLKNALTATSYDVGNAFFEMHKYDFVYSMKTWFYFNGNNWEEENDTSRIILELNQNMSDIFSKMAIGYANKAVAHNGEEKDKLLERQKQCCDISLKIRQSSFKKNIIEELTALFNKKKFIEQLDENRNLVCFSNGVFDMENMVFRHGIPDDCISMCTGTNYIPYDPEEENIKKVLDFFNQVLPDEDMREYVLTLLATCLSGHVPDEKIYIWTGSGSNAKSLCIQLTQLALGDYAAIMPITLITNKRAASNAATPELAKVKGKRLAIFQEPDNNMEINAGLMKELTGNDKIQARALFKDPIEFFPQFKPILTCNRLPIVPSTDGGTWRRIRIIPFEMKFVDNPTENYERKIDRSIKENLAIWKDAFASILVEYYRRYKVNGIREPEKVMQFTKQYEKDCDKYKVFIDNVIKEQPNSKVSMDEIYKEFSKWFKANNNGVKTMPSKTEVKYEVEEKTKKRFDNDAYLNHFTIRYHVGLDGSFRRDEEEE